MYRTIFTNHMKDPEIDPYEIGRMERILLNRHLHPFRFMALGEHISDCIFGGIVGFYLEIHHFRCMFHQIVFVSLKHLKISLGKLF